VGVDVGVDVDVDVGVGVGCARWRYKTQRSVTVQGLWTMDKLQGALVGYDYARNVCIMSIYKTLREEGKRAGGVGNIGEL